jgi:ABC-type transport system substrate-binding protein
VEFDSAVSAANSIPNPIAARAAYLQAYRVILNEAPAVWLFEPYTLGAMVRDITPVGVRPDAWWANLADWSRTSVSTSGRDTAR